LARRISPRRARSQIPSSPVIQVVVADH
jgi:hypothetical protein